LYKKHKFVIQFPAGAGGNFLSIFLDKKQTHFPKDPFRIDPFSDKEKMTYEGFFHYETYLNDTDIDKRTWADTKKRYTTHHLMDIVYPEERCIRILPKTNCWGYLKASIKKKEVLEKDFSNNVSYINEYLISEYKAAIDQDYSRPYFDYGNFWNLQAMHELYVKHNNQNPCDKRMQFVVDYTKNNYWVDVRRPADMFDVLCKIIDYEYKNNLIGIDRIWSIDDMPEDVEKALELFERNRFNYDL